MAKNLKKLFILIITALLLSVICIPSNADMSCYDYCVEEATYNTPQALANLCTDLCSGYPVCIEGCMIYLYDEVWTYLFNYCMDECPL